MKQNLLLASLALVSAAAGAQELKEGYIVWGTSSDVIGETITNWQAGTPLNGDDNFFISRVKPKARFRNSATQVRTNLTAANDKKLIAWIPVNSAAKNGLPDGVFDSEVFSMWPYVTHWGNWTAPLGRVPGSFLDVAHKNGVGVSSVAGIPYGNIFNFPGWSETLMQMTEAGADKMAQFLHYYGVDGLGYNSEFAGGYSLQAELMPFHENLVKKMRGDYANPVFENFWYDGTNDNGMITFDQGLGSHNDETFGDGEHIRTSLFLNYNWNYASLLSGSVSYAGTIGRDPLDLYAGVNMQGAQPGTNNWPLLKDYPISIGLWGAHSENMFWESRGEKGSDPAVKQNTYMLRTERWFTGGSRNPASCPEVTNSMKYNADNFTFHGMSSFMTARSSLKWDLAEEPFISYFNLGNGKFFNWKGVRQNGTTWACRTTCPPGAGGLPRRSWDARPTMCPPQDSTPNLRGTMPTWAAHRCASTAPPQANTSTSSRRSTPCRPATSSPCATNCSAARDSATWCSPNWATRALPSLKTAWACSTKTDWPTTKLG